MAKHALLSASSSHRWLECPPSAKLCAAHPDRASPYAQQGTDAHELAAYKVQKALGMKAVCAPFDAFHIPRIAQLTQRSNQFNLRTVRYSEQEIEEIAANPRYVTRYYTLRDRFGEHGLIAVVILEKRENELFVNEWLMSCRVLKRGMEQFIADSILRAAREAGVARVVGEYIPTPKNAMVKDLYASMGFRPLGDGLYEARVDDYQNHQTFITEEEAK